MADEKFFRTRYDRHQVRVKFDPAEKRTKSEFLQETDINNIIARYKRTGVLPESARAAAARYGDFSEVPTYQEMFSRIHAAQDMFLALPATVRARFDNDPGVFLEASQTKEGQELLVQLGLATAKPAPGEAAPKGEPDPAPVKAAKTKTPAQPEAKGKDDA